MKEAVTVEGSTFHFRGSKDYNREKLLRITNREKNGRGTVVQPGEPFALRPARRGVPGRQTDASQGAPRVWEALRVRVGRIFRIWTVRSRLYLSTSIVVTSGSSSLVEVYMINKTHLCRS